MADRLLEHIRQNAYPGLERACCKNDICYFADEISPFAAQNWPLDLSAEGYKTSYTDISRTVVQAGLYSGILLKTDITNDRSSYEVITEWQLLDGRLNVKIHNLYCHQGGGENPPFAGIFLSRLRTFLRQQDKEMRTPAECRYDPSQIELSAVSNNEEISTRGSYVWALQGMDFRSDGEMAKMRADFQKFASKNGVTLATADLKLFKYPFHFAMFDCGVRVKDKHNGSSPLGKAFMLNNIWAGTWPARKNNPLPEKFAAAYNRLARNPRRRQLLQKFLEAPFLRMQRRYVNKYATLNRRRSLSVYRRYAALKLNSLLGF